MKLHPCRWLPVTALAVLTAWCAEPLSPEPMGGAELAVHMEKRDEWQLNNLCGYTVEREYVLSNKHISPSARMKVQLIYRKGQHKQFHVLDMQAGGIARRSLLTLLQDESDGEGLENDKSTLSPRNYDFSILGVETCGDQECYKVRMTPKRRSEYLVDGTAWVSTREFEFVRIVGSMAKSPSLWISRPDFEQGFRDVGNGFWLSSYNSSRTKVVFLGEVDMTVKYSDYTIEHCPAPPR